MGGVTVRDFRRVLYTPDGAELRLADEEPTHEGFAPPKVSDDDMREPPDTVALRLGYDGQEYSLGEYLGEHHPDLDTFLKRASEYGKMRIGRAEVVAAMEALLEPILSAKWGVVPGVPPDEALGVDFPHDEVEALRAAEVIRSNLLRTSVFREYRMETTWGQFAAEAFTANELPFAIFERVHRPQSGRLGLLHVYKKLAWIDPESIRYIHVGEQGEFQGVTQVEGDGYYSFEGVKEGQPPKWVTRGGGGGGETFIPAKNLKVHARRREGDKIEGRPMSRAMYPTVKRLQFFDNAQIINAQKTAIGIPFYRMAQGTPPQMRAEAWKQVRSMRAANERTALVLQGDDEVGFVKMETGAMALDAVIRAAKADIRSITGTEFKGLGGEGAGGARAVGEVQEPHFNLHLKATAQSIREFIQLDIIEPLHELNFGADSAVPTLRFDALGPPDLKDKLDALKANALGPLRSVDVNAWRRELGMEELSAEEMEQHDAHAQKLREMALLPTTDEDGNPIEEEPKGRDGGGGGDDPPKAKKKGSLMAKSGGGLVERKKKKKRRGIPGDGDGDGIVGESQMAELADVDVRGTPPLGRRATLFERRVVELNKVNRGLHLAEVRLTMELRTLRDALVDQAVNRAHVRGGQMEIKPLSGKHVKAALIEAVAQTHARGAQHMREEVGRQLRDLLGEHAQLPVALAEAPAEDMHEALQLAIARDVSRLVSLVAHQVLDELISAMEETDSLDEAREIARAAVKAHSAAPMATVAREITQRSYNLGRIEEAERTAGVIEEGLQGVHADEVIRSEVLDGGTCDPCWKVYDGNVMKLGSKALRDRRPPIGCLGREKCRGILILIVQTEAERERIQREIGQLEEAA